jgi:hypothetical protein
LKIEFSSEKKQKLNNFYSFWKFAFFSFRMNGWPPFPEQQIFFSPHPNV